MTAPRRTSRMFVFASIVLAVALALSAFVLWRSFGSSVTLRNDGPAPLTAVRLTWAGSEIFAGELAPNAERRIRVNERGEGDIRLSFEAGGRAHATEACYVTPGLVVAAEFTINSELEVAALCN